MSSERKQLAFKPFEDEFNQEKVIDYFRHYLKLCEALNKFQHVYPDWQLPQDIFHDPIIKMIEVQAGGNRESLYSKFDINHMLAVKEYVIRTFRKPDEFRNQLQDYAEGMYERHLMRNY